MANSYAKKPKVSSPKKKHLFHKTVEIADFDDTYLPEVKLA